MSTLVALVCYQVLVRIFVLVPDIGVSEKTPSYNTSTMYSVPEYKDRSTLYLCEQLANCCICTKLQDRGIGCVQVQLVRGSTIVLPVSCFRPGLILDGMLVAYLSGGRGAYCSRVVVIPIASMQQPTIRLATQTMQ
jgi:hypothetical protein